MSLWVPTKSMSHDYGNIIYIFISYGTDQVMAVPTFAGENTERRAGRGRPMKGMCITIARTTQLSQDVPLLFELQQK